MKYIMFESQTLGLVPILFPDMVDHAEIHRVIVDRYSGYKAVSAGFFNVDEQGVPSVHGESAVLGLHFQPDDCLIIGIALQH